MSFGVTVLLGALAFTVTQMVAGALLPTPWATPPDNALPWLLLANLLLSACLSVFARLSDWPPRRLALGLFAVGFLVGQFNNLIEAVFFRLFTPSAFLALLPLVTPPMAAAALVIAYVRQRTPHAAPPVARRTPGAIALRLLAVGLVYFPFYFVAGLIIFPYVRDFYAPSQLPSMATLMPWQILVRGPIFGLGVLLVTRIAPGSRRQHMLLGAVTLAGIGGVIPLIVPNPLFTDAVRWVHFCEVVSENIAVGAIAGWLLSETRAILPAPAHSAQAREEIAHGEAR
jgi:hypothetical protein